MLSNHFEHCLDVHWLILILKQYTSKHIFSFSFYHSRLYAESCLEMCRFLDANQSWILLTEKKQIAFVGAEREPRNWPAHPQSTLHLTQRCREREKWFLQGTKQTEEAVRKKIIGHLFHWMFSKWLSNLDLEVKVSLPYRSVLLICLSCTQTVLLKSNECLGCIFPGMVMDWHQAHSNHLSLTSVGPGHTFCIDTQTV